MTPHCSRPSSCCRCRTSNSRPSSTRNLSAIRCSSAMRRARCAEGRRGAASGRHGSGSLGQSAAEERLRTLDTEARRRSSDPRAARRSRPAAGYGPQDSGWSSLRPAAEPVARWRRHGVRLDPLARADAGRASDRADLHLAISDPADRLIGQHLIGMVNEAGYLTGDTAGMADMLGTSRGACRGASLPVCSTCDPPGVFARDLQGMPDACSSRSATASIPPWRRSSTTSKLLGEARLCRPAQPLRVDLDDLQDMIDELRSARIPSRATPSARSPCSRSFPMSSCGRSPDGSWIVELNTETLPRC